MEIPAGDKLSLAMLAGLQTNDPIPAELLRQYERVKRLAGRLGIRGTLPAWLVIVAGINAGLGAPKACDVADDCFAAQVQQGKVKPNDRISVKWRNGDKEAVFLRITPNGQVTVLLDGEKNERHMNQDKCSLLELEPVA